MGPIVISDKDRTFYLDVAHRAAQRSVAERLQVGAVIVSVDHVNAVGYNGTPAGWDNDCEDADGLTKPEVIHAEMNALAKFQNSGLSPKGSTMFITHAPCIECSKAMFLAGVRAVYYAKDYRSMTGPEFLRKAKIDVIKQE